MGSYGVWLGTIVRGVHQGGRAGEAGIHMFPPFMGSLNPEASQFLGQVRVIELLFRFGDVSARTLVLQEGAPPNHQSCRAKAFVEHQ